MSEKQSVDFFFNPLKSKLLIALITCQILFVLLFQRIFGKVFFLAPDERGYLQVAKDVYSTDYDYVQWGWPWRSPVWFLQLIYSPFKFMLEVGIPDLIAFRFNTILYSSLSIYLMLAILYVHYPPTELLRRHKFSLLTIFLPTYFLWSTLGLRESFLYFSFSLIGSGIVLLTNARWRLGFLLMSTGCIFLAYTKDYMYLIFVVSLLFLILLRSLRKQISFKLTSLYLIALIIPILLTPSITLSLHGQVKQIVFGDEAPRANLAGNSTGGEIGAWGTERGLVENCDDNSSIEYLLKWVKPSEKISLNDPCQVAGSNSNFPNESLDPSNEDTGNTPSNEDTGNTPSNEDTGNTPSNEDTGNTPSNEDTGNTPSKTEGTDEVESNETLGQDNNDVEESPNLLSGDESEWESSRAAKLSLVPAHITEPGKLFIQFIKMITLPMPLLDNGSSVLNIVAWESPIWLTLILFVYLSLIMSLISRKKLSDLNLWSSTFIFGILLSSALTEINVGTMVRHRSLVLILCLFVILTMDKSIYEKNNIRRLVASIKRTGE
jgi:hypothetical protein